MTALAIEHVASVDTWINRVRPLNARLHLVDDIPMATVCSGTTGG
jgi:hypothetical protein